MADDDAGKTKGSMHFANQIVNALPKSGSRPVVGSSKRMICGSITEPGPARRVFFHTAADLCRIFITHAAESTWPSRSSDSCLISPSLSAVFSPQWKCDVVEDCHGVSSAAP